LLTHFYELKKILHIRIGEQIMTERKTNTKNEFSPYYTAFL